MSARQLHCILQVIGAVFAFLLRFEFLQIFQIVRFFIQIRVINPSPTFSFSPLKILLQFPPRLIIRPVMQINTTISEHTIATVMEILTQAGVIIKPTCTCRPITFSPCRAIFPFISLFWVVQFRLSQPMICIIVCSSINFAIQLPFFNLFCHLHVLQVFPFGLFRLCFSCLVSSQNLCLFYFTRIVSFLIVEELKLFVSGLVSLHLPCICGPSNIIRLLFYFDPHSISFWLQLFLPVILNLFFQMLDFVQIYLSGFFCFISFLEHSQKGQEIPIYYIFRQSQNIMRISLVTIFCLLAAGLSYGPRYEPVSCDELNFLPMPKSLKCDIQNKQEFKFEDPCAILYTIKGDKSKTDFVHFIELIEHMQYKTFGCHVAHVVVGDSQNPQSQFKLIGFKYTVTINVEDPQLQSALETKDEAYKITIANNGATITAPKYVGFVHALETFMQSITCDKYHVTNCSMIKLPIEIEDQPEFSWRAVMVDTARHYQPINLLYETVDALMYNKMSVMHWHIVDEDSFPLRLDSHPEIAEYGAFSAEQIYTPDQVKDLVRYGLVRGIRIVPELDTPGHAASWGKAPENKEKACTFGGTGYMGPLDVTLDSTYTLVKEVFAEIFSLFSDPVVHLGGDEVVLTCLNNRTQFIQKEGIKDNEIELHYRKKQHQILKAINPNKTLMYWMNSRINVEPEDIVHWWGGGLPQTQNKIVISQYGPFYIDMGVGNYYGVNYGSYSTWLDLYNQNIGRMVASYANKQNVLGAEITLWSEISNRFTHHLKIWIRGSSLAERTWTIANYPAKPNFFRRITAHERLMNRRGIPTAPATCQQCEFHPQFC